MKTFPTMEELRGMTIKQIKAIDIADAEQEAAIQTVLNEKLQDAPIEHQVYRGDVPDIKTKEDEEKWQKIIDDRENSHRPQDHQQETEVDMNKMPVDTIPETPETDEPENEPESDPVMDEDDMADEEVPEKSEEELLAEIETLENEKKLADNQ